MVYSTYEAPQENKIKKILERWQVEQRSEERKYHVSYKPHVNVEQWFSRHRHIQNENPKIYKCKKIKKLLLSRSYTGVGVMSDNEDDRSLTVSPVFHSLWHDFLRAKTDQKESQSERKRSFKYLSSAKASVQFTWASLQVYAESSLLPSPTYGWQMRSQRRKTLDIRFCLLFWSNSSLYSMWKVFFCLEMWIAGHFSISLKARYEYPFS